MTPPRASSSSKTAWVQLYEARSMITEIEVSRTPGRPPSPVPRRKIGTTLSQGEIHELNKWQKRLSDLLDRKVSTGETVGILARVCSARLARIQDQGNPKTLEDLVQRMIGEK
ncbi:MAG: hypothetical protein GYA48_01165 [Chloroflexi bacterium]|nr:hypothetical protein [Ornatilinea apprima]NMC52234.1 hypothetical protein [Chloroflexota bacterium]